MTHVMKILNWMFLPVFVATVASELTGCDLIRLRFNSTKIIPYRVLKKDWKYELREYEWSGSWLDKFSNNSWRLFELLKSDYKNIYEENGRKVKAMPPVITSFFNSRDYPVRSVSWKLPYKHPRKLSDKGLYPRNVPHHRIKVHVKCFRRISDLDIKTNMDDLITYIAVDNSNIAAQYYADYYLDQLDFFPFAELWLTTKI